MSTTVTPKMQEEIRRLVKKGDYTNESEVIRDGLRLLFGRNRQGISDEEFDEKVKKALEAHNQDPSRGIPIGRASGALDEAIRKNTRK